MRKLILLFTVLFLSSFPLLATDASPDPVNGYVQARSQQEKAPYSVDVTIEASIPSMHKTGKLRAVRQQTEQGRFAYRDMKFEGDGMIKTNVIARYLTAEVEAQKPEEKLATQISPINYEFKLKGRETVDGREVLVYQVKPKKKRAGLFHGQIWIDAASRLPIKEAGKLAKLPSVWLKEIAFTREYATVAGVSVISRITSEIKTRIVGKAQVSVAFDNYRFEGAEVDVAGAAVLPDAPIAPRAASLYAVLAPSPAPYYGGDE